MHDVRAIREEPERFISGWERRGVADALGLVRSLQETDRALRAAQTAVQALQSRRNDASKLIGAAKAKRDEARAAELMAEVAGIKGEIEAQLEAERAAGQSLKDELAKLPNLPAADVPDGPDETANVEMKRWGDPASLPAARLDAPKDHATLGEALGLMDFERAARMSGSRFVALKGGLARLERALGQFMLDVQTVEHGYGEVSPPLMVRDEAMFGTGQLPKFFDEQYCSTTLIGSTIQPAFTHAVMGGWEATKPFGTSMHRRSGPEEAKRVVDAGPLEFSNQYELPRNYFERRWLIPTAEVSLTNLVREEITPEEQLPLRMTALTPSFRSEAGASGRDTRGMIRQHQFYKVELVSITTPEQSDAEHERMTACAEAVLERLGLPYRRMLLCAGDMGFSARKTFDLEVWLPSDNSGRGGYREISSCSNCGDFQARRMDARTKKLGEKGARFVHTLNGSGLAVGRTLVAVMENYQQADGSIAVPPALVPYMGGVERIAAAA